jgi:hypothetical protein
VTVAEGAAVQVLDGLVVGVTLGADVHGREP